MGKSPEQRVRLWNGYIGYKLLPDIRDWLESQRGESRLVVDPPEGGWPELTDQEKESIEALASSHGYPKFDSKYMDFSDYILSDSIDFSGLILVHSNFRSARFLHQALFKKARFDTTGDFSNTQFDKGADFDQAHFKAQAFFAESNSKARQTLRVRSSFAELHLDTLISNLPGSIMHSSLKEGFL